MSGTFGDLVRRGREEAGLSQSRLAVLIGKSPTTVRAWEHGRTNPADPEAVAALAAVLGLDETELLGHAGFDAQPARTRLSAREELTSLAKERTEMIALAPSPETPTHKEATHPPVSPEPDSDWPDDWVHIPLVVEPERKPAEVVIDPAEVKIEIETENAVEPSSPIPMAVMEPQPKFTGPKFTVPRFTVPKITMPKITVPKISMPKLSLPKTTASRPTASKPRIVIAQQPTPTAVPTPNGFVTGRSYLEDEEERDFYRRRGVTTAIVLVFLVIVIWWALGRAGGAFGDLIESIVGLLDI